MSCMTPPLHGVGGVATEVVKGSEKVTLGCNSGREREGKK